MNDGNKKRKKRKDYGIKWSEAVRWKAIVFEWIPLMIIFQGAFLLAILDLKESWKEIEKARAYIKEYREEKSRLFTILNKHDRVKSEKSSESDMMFLVRDHETGRTAVIENLSAKTFMSYKTGDKVWFKVEKKILYSDEELKKVSGRYNNGAIMATTMTMILALLLVAAINDFNDGLVLDGNNYTRQTGEWSLEKDARNYLNKIFGIAYIVMFIIPGIQIVGIWIAAAVYEWNVL
jgi:hypothetical protein